jgi:hypothetical protein
MKKTIITGLFVIGMITSSVGQQQVIQMKDPIIISRNSMTAVTLKHFDYGEDGSTYAIYFKNARYQTIINVEYIKFATKEDLLQFFDICDSAYINEKKYITAIYSVAKSMGKSVIVYNEKGDYFFSTLAAITKMREEFIAYDLGNNNK